MKHVVTAALVVSLLAGTVAMANPQDNRDRGYQERGNTHDRRDDRDRRFNDDRRGHDDRRSHDNRRSHDDRWDRSDHRDHRPDYRGRYRLGEYHRPHGYRYHSWRRGDRLPVAYRDRTYVVHNYHAYNLHNPPRGYHWVRVDNDVVLTAIATGAVLSVINNLFY